MRIKRILRKRPYLYGVLAFLLPLVILIGTYIGLGVFPFGSRATMIIDSYHQYVPFFSELHDKIWHGDSLLYSWHGSLGFNYLAVQAYYLASPLNLLIALFPSTMMIEAFECMIILKICLSSVSAWYYLRQRTLRSTYATVIFAGFYALGGFTVAYNWNVMWLDSIVLFPLILMGAERLINKKDGRLYTIALGLAIFVNYYMAIMICIFLILYFFVIWFSKKRNGVAEFLKSGCHFALSSILAGGMAAVYLLPTYYTLINSSQGSKPTKFEIYRNFIEVFRQEFVLVEPTQLTGAPNIYCGVMIGMLVGFYVISRKISLRKKIVNLLVTAFVFVSLNINVLDYVWHGFHFPNNLPGRFSFIYIFMVVVMAYDAWIRMRLTKGIGYAIVLILEAILFGVCIWYPEERLPIYSMAVTGVFMAVYMLLLIADKQKVFLPIKKFKLRPRHMIVILMTAELIANTAYGLSMNGTTSRENYTRDKVEVAEIRKAYEATDTFYRMELADMRGRDDVTWHNLNGLSFFSSTADDRLEKLMGALGFYNSGNKYSYKGATPLTDAMLAIRYVISNNVLTASNLSLTEQTENKYIYENTENLSVGYMVKPKVASWKILEGEPFNIQNDFVQLATNTKTPLFTQLEISEPEITGGEITSTDEDKYFYSREESEGKLTWHLIFNEQEDVYLYFEASHSESLKVTVNDSTATYSDERGHIVHIGQCEPGTVVTLEFPMDKSYSSGNVKLQAYGFSQLVFQDVYNQLAASQLEVTSYDSTHITGHISANEDGLLMMSIPYDEGWSIKVDGQAVEMEAVGEALMGCYLTAGNHTVELTYIPQGFMLGMCISIVSVLLFVVLCMLKTGKFSRRHAK